MYPTDAFQNILIARKNPIWVKISDFGISKRTTGTDLRTVCGTPCYKAPELQGLLPTGLGRREFYTNAVDLWALGAIIHLLLTAEIPFLHTFLDTDMTDITTTSDDQPELDMTLLCAYCNGTEAFPTDSLRKHQVCDDGIDLIKRLMAVNPENRVTAKTASRSPWLVGTDTPNLNPTTDNVTGSCPGLLQTEFRHLGVSLTEEDARQLYRTENKDTIKQILNYSKEDLWPPIAVTGGYMEVTKILLRLDVIGHHNLLVVAARAGRMAIIQFLLNHGCGQDDYHVGSNPLLEAVKGGHLDAITFLLSHGTESDWGVNDVHQFPALQIAALAGQVDAMELLLAAGADPTTPATQNGGLTALQAASSCGHMAAVNLLLSRRVIAPNEVPAQKCGRTAVQAAAGGGHVDVIKVLLKKKCRVNEPPAAIGGRTAFQAAAEGGHLEAMKFLQQNGADIHAAPCWEDGLTALQAAAGGGHLSVVKFLLKMGVNHHERPGFRGGRTALQAAASNGHCNVMKFLIENGAHHNQHLATENGMTALQAAVVGGHVKALRVLLNHGVFSINQPIEMEAKPFEKATSQSPLEFAVGQENLEMVRALLDGDALVDKQVLQKARKRGEKQGNNQMIFLLRQAMERSRLVSFLLLHGTLSDTPVNKAGLAKLVVVCSGI